MGSLTPDPQQLRFEQQCLERFERQARALEDRFASQSADLAQCRDQLADVQNAYAQLKTHQKDVDALLADARIALMRLEHFEQRARHSFKTQLALPIRELWRRLRRT